MKRKKSKQYRPGLFLGVFQVNQNCLMFDAHFGVIYLYGLFESEKVTMFFFFHMTPLTRKLTFLIHLLHHFRRRPFSGAQDTFAYTLLKECGHKQPRPPPNVVCAIGSQCAPDASWVHSHLYLELSTYDGITDVNARCEGGRSSSFDPFLCHTQSYQLPKHLAEED